MARRRRESQVYWGAFVLGWFEHLQAHDLVSSDYKVLFFLCQNMKIMDNTVYMRQKEIAEKLTMDKGNVSKCIKKLCEKQFIVKCPNGFMINPHLFYVGKSNPRDREELRDVFYDLIMGAGLSPRFNLNEDYHRLEELSEDGDVNTSEDDYVFDPDDLF